MRTITAALLLSLALVVSLPGAVSAGTSPTHRAARKLKAKRSAPAPTHVAWQTDIAVAFEQARKKRKVVMIDFYTDWCGFCKVMDRDVYTDAHICALAKKFVPIKANPEKDRIASAMAHQAGVQGFPTLIFATTQGKILKAHAGYEDAFSLAQDMQAALEIAKK